jgi:ribose transport system ATP-binding protein
MHVEMNDIYKSFGANRVLTGVNFELHEGEVHALMGENGAGKSTLMNILIGLHKRDQGTIMIDGQETYFANPKEAEKSGIAFIHQELNVWRDMTVLDNLFIGKELSSSIGLLNIKEMRKLANEQFNKLSVTIPLNQEAGECSVGEKQMIEIAKALMTNAKVIVMDEPTAALTEREIQKLFEVIASLKKDGVSIVYISHRMEEIFAICDRITVMRDGKTVDTKPIPETNLQTVSQLVKLSLGKLCLKLKTQQRRDSLEMLIFLYVLGKLLASQD